MFKRRVSIWNILHHDGCLSEAILVCALSQKEFKRGAAPTNIKIIRRCHWTGLHKTAMGKMCLLPKKTAEAISRDFVWIDSQAHLQWEFISRRKKVQESQSLHL